MQKFKTFMGNVIDLDDLNNHLKENVEKGWAELRLDCWRELGYAVIYMNHIYDDIPWEEQKEKVNVLIKELKVNMQNDDKLYWLKFLYRIHDEIENLC